MNKNGNFKSSIGFILACVGSAVGMGNIWMFPYRLGQYGGAAFLIPYLVFIVLLFFLLFHCLSLLSSLTFLIISWHLFLPILHLLFLH